MKLPVGILGASGEIGKQYIHLLKNHPWFEITFLASSEKRVGELSACGIPFSSLEDIDKAKKECRFLFSALPNTIADGVDEKYVENGLSMISHASCHRMKENVPLIIPEVNSSHLSLIEGQKNFLIAKPNCALMSFVLPLSPLQCFGIKEISVTTMQSLSGAGLAALSDHNLQNNVVPYIAGEEEKLEKEPQKIWHNQNIKISAQCNRIPTMYGHYAMTSVSFEKKPTKEEIIKVWNSFHGLKLPSAPKQPLIYLDGDDKPQIKADLHDMSVSLGRLKPCPLFDFRFAGLSHNTVRGGAGGGILIAELLHQKGLL